MQYFILFFTMFVVLVIISYLWVIGIDNMMKNHPDYKGEDLFNEKSEDNETDIHK